MPAEGSVNAVRQFVGNQTGPPALVNPNKEYKQ